MRFLKLAVLALTVCATALMLASCSSGLTDDSTTVIVTHGPVTPVAIVMGADDGVGTVRTFHSAVTFEDIGKGVFDAIMTTTWVDEAVGAETRVTKIVFVLDGSNDQLILEGSSLYPSAGSTIKLASSVTRPVIGGTGKWSGARGSAETTHLDDNSWKHVFELLP